MGVGAIIRQRREQLGLTQDVLAARIEISKPYLSNIETGRAKNPPTDSILVAMEKAMGFEPNQLVTLAHWERSPKDVRQRQEDLEAEVRKLRQVVRELLSGARKPNGSLDMDALGAGPAAKRQALPAEPSATRRDDDVSERIATPAGAMRAGRIVPIINKVAAGYPQHFTDLDYPPGVADDYLRCPDLDDPQAFALHVVGDSMEPIYHERDIVIFSPNTPARDGDDCFVRFEADCATTFKRFYQDDESTIRLQPLNNRYPAQSYPRQQITGLWPAVFRFERLRR
jgi:phage repressor protein C with HTH and peptisase S24 domain/transcriptional regulator with XRE-family HTH domain